MDILGIAMAFAVGTVTGVLSGYGVGGGTLLMIYLGAVAGLGQTAAQGINLLYFLPCSGAALVSHVKNKLVDMKIAIPAIIAGVICTVISAIAANSIDTGVLRRFFGVFLLIVGVSELFRKQ